MAEYDRMLLAINSANLTASIENVSINEDILEARSGTMAITLKSSLC